MTAPTGKVVHGDPWTFAQHEHDHPSRNWHGMCQDFTHSAFGVPSDGTPSAAAAWERAKYRHPETDPANIPRGVPVFWTGGSHGFGHAAVSRGGGSVWGTDLVRDGQVDVYPINDVHTKWGLTLAGWTEDIDGVRVWQPDAAKPAPEKKPAPAAPSAPKHATAKDALDAALASLHDGRSHLEKDTPHFHDFSQAINHLNHARDNWGKK
ncbi:MAG: hypothetical protein FWE71_09875 [Nocardioidaceae bacterium]|nr:hypothetical protein [Nocardioidaceae bacterium]MCL2611935.1 hypothetical protein [Nocardioidaceae bacterium]